MPRAETISRVYSQRERSYFILKNCPPPLEWAETAVTGSTSKEMGSAKGYFLTRPQSRRMDTCRKHRLCWLCPPFTLKLNTDRKRTPQGQTGWTEKLADKLSLNQVRTQLWKNQWSRQRTLLVLKCHHNTIPASVLQGPDRFTGHLETSTKVAPRNTGQQGQAQIAHEQVSSAERVTVRLIQKQHRSFFILLHCQAGFSPQTLDTHN